MRTIDVSIGGQTVTVKPLRGLAARKAFDAAVREEAKAFVAGSLDYNGAMPRLLKLGIPDLEQIDFSAAERHEFLALLAAALDLNFPLEGQNEARLTESLELVRQLKEMGV
jgi:hypothetical protein